MNQTLLDNVRRLSSLISHTSSHRLTESDVDFLQECLEEGRDSWHRGPPEFEIASAIVTQAVEEQAFDAPLLPRVVLLAQRVGCDPSELIDEVIDREDWNGVSEILDQVDNELTSHVVNRFLADPTKRFATLLVRSHCLSGEQMDAARMHVAGVGAEEFLRIASQWLSDRDLCDLLQSWMIADQNFLRRAQLVAAYATSDAEPQLLNLLVAGMQSLRSSDDRRSYHSSHRESVDKVKQAHEECMRLICSSDCFVAAAHVMPRLNELCDLPLHAHRKLRKCALQFSKSVAGVLPDHLSSLVACFELTQVRRVHPAALRYSLRYLSDETRAKFCEALRSADSSIADAVQGVAESNGEDDSGPIYDPRSEFVEVYDPEARIWPRNTAVVTKLARPLISAHRGFQGLVQSEWKRDEDSLSERLVAFVHSELKTCERDGDIEKWIRDQGLYGGLSVDEPYIRDREPEMGADIALIVKYHVSGVLDHTWVYLLQAKKGKGGDTCPTRWDVDRGQLDDLLLTTRAGFYVLYTPEIESEGCYVIPAQTIESAMLAGDATRRSGEKAKSIPYATGKRLGKPWSAFLLEDVFGAWSGEPNEELERLAGDGQLAPFVFRVTLTAGQG